jgi:hypothetical protein
MLAATLRPHLPAPPSCKRSLPERPAETYTAHPPPCRAVQVNGVYLPPCTASASFSFASAPDKRYSLGHITPFSRPIFLTMQHFILKRILPLALGLFLASQCGAETLRKVRKATTDVAYAMSVGVPYTLSQHELQSQLEEKLKSAGLRVLTKSEDANDKEVNPVVKLRVYVLPVSAEDGAVVACTYRVDISVHQAGRVPLNGSAAPVELWHSGNIGFSLKNSFAQDIQVMVDRISSQLVKRLQADNGRP